MGGRRVVTRRLEDSPILPHARRSERSVDILREFVLRTTVILTPGACGREVPSGSPWTGSAGSGGIRGNPRMGSLLRAFGIKNNENENPILKLLILNVLFCEFCDFFLYRCRWDTHLQPTIPQISTPTPTPTTTPIQPHPTHPTQPFLTLSYPTLPPLSAFAGQAPKLSTNLSSYSKPQPQYSQYTNNYSQQQSDVNKKNP